MKTHKKKKNILLAIAIFILIMSMVSCTKSTISTGQSLKGGEIAKLKVKGTQLCTSNGDEIQLKGMSSHGLGWFGDYINKESIKYTKEEMGANIIRLAMYSEGSGSYMSSPNTNKTKVYEGIDAAIELGMYVIVDWHVLSEKDPNKYKEEAKEFFKEVTSKYKDCPNIIYEICNEPNGDNVTWSDNIKPYADEVIPVIRKNAPNSIVIVGTGSWCQDVTDPISDPLKFKNVMYACHFYAGSHTQWLRDRVDEALNNGIPIIVSEWGTSAADGDGGIFPEETLTWMEFLEERNISWLNWSLCNKGEASAALKPSASFDGNWTDEDLSESGKLVKEAMLNGSSGLKNYIDNNY